MWFGRKSRNPLDDRLWAWDDGTPFTVRDMLRSVNSKGITGSGKTTGTYQHVLENLVAHPRATLSIFAQKEEEEEQVSEAFARAGRSDDLIVVKPGGEEKCNFYQAMAEMGFDTRDLVEFGNVVSASIRQQGGNDHDPFWAISADRFNYNAIAAVGMGDKITAPNLLSFFATAPRDPARMDDAWRAQYHYQTMRKAAVSQKTPAQMADWRVASAFWATEYPGMADRTRSSIEAHCMLPLSIACSGMAHVMTCMGNSVTPAMHDRGKSILWCFPSSVHGPMGRYITAGAKYLTQRHILKRRWNPGDFFNVMICDEYQESLSDFDPLYLSQCRSHGGCFLTLTQTANSEYSRLTEHKADMLLANFGTHVCHLGDARTESFISGLLGQRMEAFPSISGEGGLYEAYSGKSGISVSFQYTPVLQPGFLQGPWMRTGGPGNGYQVTALVVTPGRAFRSGEVFSYVTFHQRRG